MIDRRLLLGGAAALMVGAGRPPGEVAVAAARMRPANAAAARAALAAIEATLGGGRLGLAALDSASGRRLLWREQERFAMASTFKLALAAAVLADVDRGRLRLDQAVPFTAADLLDYAPYVRAHAGAGSLPIGGLAEAAVVVSDNSAANLLLPLVGGPPGLTRFVRARGDGATRLDRIEPELNSNLPGDPRDTTTPAAMAGLLRVLLTGPALAAASRERLIGWMIACETGKARLRAGVPPGWSAGDKTGSGARGGSGDIAIFRPPRRPPILVACYVDAAASLPEVRDAAYARAAALIARAFA